jgi:hypothetical protein
MVTLFETEQLFVTLTSKNAATSNRDCTLSDADGALVATACDDTSGIGRLARVLQSSQSGRYEWTVRDAADNRLLEVVKPRRGMRGPRPEVSFADGTLLGTAVPTSGSTPIIPASFEGLDGTVFGELVPALGERRSHPVLMYRVREEDGKEVGEIAQVIEGDWGFHLAFTPDADLSVRALTIAWTLCLAQERTTAPGF